MTECHWPTGRCAMTTTNTSAFAMHYMWGAQLLMDAIATPRSETFDKAHQHAIHALNAAFVVKGAPGGGIEWGLGHELARSIENAAHAHGYAGLPATRKHVLDPTQPDGKAHL
jgi:hypothetical protein